MTRSKGLHGMTQRHRAYRPLHEALVLRRLTPGERIHEPEWTARLDVNRTALREALARLCAEGLVVEGAKCGYAVPAYTEKDFAEMISARLVIETAAIVDIVRRERNQGRDLQRLQALCDDLEWIVTHDYGIDVTEPDHLFHRALVELGGNTRLAAMHRCLPLIRGADLVTCTEDRSLRARRILEEHRSILDAIEHGHLGVAIQRLEQHARPAELGREQGTGLAVADGTHGHRQNSPMA